MLVCPFNTYLCRYQSLQLCVTCALTSLSHLFCMPFMALSQNHLDCSYTCVVHIRPNETFSNLRFTWKWAHFRKVTGKCLDFT